MSVKILVLSILTLLLSGCIYDNSTRTKLSVGGIDILDPVKVDDFLIPLKSFFKEEEFSISRSSNGGRSLTFRKLVDGNLLRCNVATSVQVVSIICTESWSPLIPLLPARITAAYSQFIDGLIAAVEPFGITKIERHYYNGKYVDMTDL
jgi:hypothetical protein